MRLKIIAPIFTVLLILVGCQGTQNDANRNIDQPNENTSFENRDMNDNRFDRVRNTTERDRSFTNDVTNRDRDALNRSSNNRHDRYDISKEAADRIVDEITEINQAYVLTTGKNAYVAATLDAKKETRQNVTQQEKRQNSTTMDVRQPNDRHANERTTNQGDTNERGQDNHMTNFRSNNPNGDGEELTLEVKNKISDIVQDVDSTIENVYVSTSPDFFDLTNNYADDLDAGRPVRGFFDQIGNTIERIFPQN